MKAVEGKLRTSWQSYPSPTTTLTYLLQSLRCPSPVLPSTILEDTSSLWWLWNCLQPGACPGLQERWSSDPKAQWSEECTWPWRHSISDLYTGSATRDSRVRTWWNEKPLGLSYAKHPGPPWTCTPPVRFSLTLNGPLVCYCVLPSKMAICWIPTPPTAFQPPFISGYYLRS